MDSARRRAVEPEGILIRAAPRRGPVLRFVPDSPVADVVVGAARPTFVVVGNDARWMNGVRDQIFERRWAMTVLGQVRAVLEKEYRTSNQGKLFGELRFFLLGDKSHGTYAEVGSRVGLTEAATKMAVSRLWHRYDELFREVIAHTVADPRDVEEEIRHLMAALAT